MRLRAEGLEFSFMVEADLVAWKIPQFVELLTRKCRSLFSHHFPGSEDHVWQYVAQVPMDEDLNNYDSFQPVIDHPLMSRKQWLGRVQDVPSLLRLLEMGI